MINTASVTSLRKLRKTLKYLAVIGVFCVLLITGWLYQGIFLIKAEQDTTIIIPNRTPVRQVADLLNSNGVQVNRYIFHLVYHIFYYINHKPIQAGEYTFKASSNMIAILEKMIYGEVVKHNITIPEGYTLYQLLELLRSTNTLIPSSRPYNIKLSEGYFLPDTYSYTYGMTDFDVLVRMQKAMITLLMNEWPNRDKKIDNFLKNPEEVLILASIVEKEAIFHEEKAVISGVYLNRLQKAMKLQADPTVIYGITKGRVSFNRRVTFNDLKHDSLYNTYIHNGLPPTPICNPSKSSVLAVLHPKWHTNLFFVANVGGRHIFSQTFSEHKGNIRNIRKVTER